MESTISLIKQFSTSKEGVELFIHKTVQEVQAGNVNALELNSYLKAIELVTEGIKKEIKESSLREHSKYSEKAVSAYGFKIEQAEKQTYDYAKCGDLEWNNLEDQLLKLSVLKKNREQVLRLITKPVTVADDETGEMYTIHPPVKTSTTGLKFTLQ